MPIYFKHTVALLVKAEHNPVVLSVLVNHFASYQWTWVAVWKLCLWYFTVPVYVLPPPSKARGREASLEHDSCRKATAVLVTSSQEEDRKSCGVGDCSQGPRGKCFSAFTGLERDRLERGLCRKLCSDIFIPGTPLNLPQS